MSTLTKKVIPLAVITGLGLGGVRCSVVVKKDVAFSKPLFL